MNNDIERILFDEEQIQTRVAELAAQITNDYQGKRPVIVSVLTGAVLFTVDLIKKIDLYAEMDFVDVSSYYGGTASSGTVKLLHDLKHLIAGKDVIIVEDIVDTGRTLRFLMELLEGRGATSIKVCTFFDKPAGREVEVATDYVGFDVPHEFLVGYGLDYENYYRNLPYVGVLKPEVYQKNDD